MKTTLSKIRAHEPCISGWEKLLGHLGKTKADDEPLSIITILDNNGLNDALWCLRAVDGYDREIRLYAVWCARQVQHLTKDSRGICALDVAERFADGNATESELSAARAAAGAAARDAAWDAAWAATSAAWDTTRTVAWDAAWTAAWAATGAARSAARAAAWNAAWTAACGVQAEELRRLCAEIDSRPAPWRLPRSVPLS